MAAAAEAQTELDLSQYSYSSSKSSGGGKGKKRNLLTPPAGAIISPYTPASTTPASIPSGTASSLRTKKVDDTKK